jgi:hypothetical protein
MVILFPLSAYADSRLNNCLQYKEEIVLLLESENVSSDYFYLAVCESGCRIKTSPKGARGFFQIMKYTYSKFKPVICSIDDIDDIKCNTLAAAKYIKHLKDKYNRDFKTTIKMYNRGGINYIKYGTTKEANSLAYCVVSKIKEDIDLNESETI